MNASSAAPPAYHDIFRAVAVKRLFGRAGTDGELYRRCRSARSALNQRTCIVRRSPRSRRLRSVATHSTHSSVWCFSDRPLPRL